MRQYRVEIKHDPYLDLVFKVPISLPTKPTRIESNPLRDNAIQRQPTVFTAFSTIFLISPTWQYNPRELIRTRFFEKALGRQKFRFPFAPKGHHLIVKALLGFFSRILPDHIVIISRADSTSLIHLIPRIPEPSSVAFVFGLDADAVLLDPRIPTLCGGYATCQGSLWTS
jgi:hypothetical protein